MLLKNDDSINYKDQFFTKKSSQRYLKKTVLLRLIFILLGLFSLSISAFSQNFNQTQFRGNFIPRNAFQQEIARLEITVEREGHIPLPMTMVPRVRKGDLIRIRMLEETINGIMPDESYWDWTLVLAFVNPSRNRKQEESVSREVNFKRDGWYREHLFKAPFDSQPVFFLYPKSKYRKKIKSLIKKNFSQIKKIGEKTLEIAGAYAHISMFLNELQTVINKDQFGFGGFNQFTFGAGSQLNDTFFRNEMVERIAQSFNIRLPDCWSGGGFSSNSNNFVSRAQCVAKNVRIEDFDVSVGKIIQQGGLFAASRLVEKFPELAYWINVAAAALDFILRATRRSPLRIVPTMAKVRGNQGQGNFNNNNSGDSNRSRLPPSQKISLYAQDAPTDIKFVTAFPVVLHKWQPEADPEVISLPTPRLMEPCLHTGQNILKNTDISYDWLRDPFTRNFRLIMSSDNGFSKEFYLTKNLGMSGWELLLDSQVLQTFPKVQMKIKTKIVATRGFSEIESKSFSMAIAGGGKWELAGRTDSEFSVGGKRKVFVKNTFGSTRCLQSITYRPSFGGQFTFVARSSSNPLRFSGDGKEAWFEIDTTHFQPGQGTLEMRGYGSNQPQSVQIALHPQAPEITKLRVHKGDNKVFVEGLRIDQIKTLTINGKLAQPSQEKTPQQQPNGQNAQKEFIFQDLSEKILTKNVSVEMQLNGGRQYKYPKQFPVLPARPAILMGDKKEIEAVILKNDSKATRFDLSKYPVVRIDTKKMSLVLKATLTDYSFKTENVSIETRIENGQVGQSVLPFAAKEVLDPSNLRISFTFNDQHQQYLAGRRLQFRIKDRFRGDSDWYTIKQTFVRIPDIQLVTCQNKQCKIIGKGLDYIGQFSTDGGNVWQPPLQAQPTSDGKSFMIILGVKNKKLLRIKLRDFPNTEGLNF